MSGTNGQRPRRKLELKEKYSLGRERNGIKKGRTPTSPIAGSVRFFETKRAKGETFEGEGCFQPNLEKGEKALLRQRERCTYEKGGKVSGDGFFLSAD